MAGLRPGLILRLLAQGKPDPFEKTGIQPREHVALILLGITGTRQQARAVALDDPRVMAGRKPRRPGALGEGEQLCEAKAPVATDARIRSLTGGVAPNERRDDGPSELIAQIEGHVRQAA